MRRHCVICELASAKTLACQRTTRPHGFSGYVTQMAQHHLHLIAGRSTGFTLDETKTTATVAPLTACLVTDEATFKQSVYPAKNI